MKQMASHLTFKTDSAWVCALHYQNWKHKKTKNNNIIFRLPETCDREVENRRSKKSSIHCVNLLSLHKTVKFSIEQILGVLVPAAFIKIQNLTQHPPPPPTHTHACTHTQNKIQQQTNKQKTTQNTKRNMFTSENLQFRLKNKHTFSFDPWEAWCHSAFWREKKLMIK